MDRIPFLLAMVSHDNLRGENVFSLYFVYFQHDGKMWNSSLDSGYRTYLGRQVHFTTFKLPIDGIICSDEYMEVEGSAMNDTVNNEHTVGAVNTILTKLEQYYPWIADPTSTVHINYMRLSSRFALSCWNAPRSHRVAVKFEIGTSEVFINKRSITRKELNVILAGKG